LTSKSHNSPQSNHSAKRAPYEVAPCERAFAGAFGFVVGPHGEEPIDFPIHFLDLRNLENLVASALDSVLWTKSEISTNEDQAGTFDQ